MRKFLGFVVAVLVVIGLPATPTMAAGPDISDPCGTTDVSDRTALPWQDLCSATFASRLAEDGTVTVTVDIVFDGALGDRTPSNYEAIFSEGDCEYWLMHEDGDAVRAPTDHAQVRCGPTKQVPCDPEVLEQVGFFCLEMPDATFHPITFSTEGRTVTLTFVTSTATTGLPLSRDDVVDHLSVAAAQSVAGEGKWDSKCSVRDGRGTDCTSDFGDHAWTDALGHTIE